MHRATHVLPNRPGSRTHSGVHIGRSASVSSSPERQFWAAFAEDGPAVGRKCDMCATCGRLQFYEGFGAIKAISYVPELGDPLDDLRPTWQEIVDHDVDGYAARMEAKQRPSAPIVP
jgi:hypothetical protein